MSSLFVPKKKRFRILKFLKTQLKYLKLFLSLKVVGGQAFPWENKGNKQITFHLKFMFTEENTSFYALYMYYQACLQRSRRQALRIATLVFAFHIFVSKIALVTFLTNCFQLLNHLQCVSTGQDICLGKPLDDTLLQLVRQEVQQLSDSFDKFCKIRPLKLF